MREAPPCASLSIRAEDWERVHGPWLSFSNKILLLLSIRKLFSGDRWHSTGCKEGPPYFGPRSTERQHVQPAENEFGVCTLWHFVHEHPQWETPQNTA